jgi:hypothetical protein
MSGKNKDTSLDDDDFGFIETGEPHDTDDADFAFEGMPDAPSSGSSEGFGFAEEDEFAPPARMDDVDHDEEGGFADDADDEVVAIPKPDPTVNMRTRRAEQEDEGDPNLFGDLDDVRADEDADDGEDEEEEEAYAESGQKPGAKGRMIFYASAAAAVLGIGVIAYNFVLPQTGLLAPFTSTETPALVTSNFDDALPTAPSPSTDVPGATLPGATSTGVAPATLPPEETVQVATNLPPVQPVRTVTSPLAVPSDEPAPSLDIPSSGGNAPSGDVAALQREITSLVSAREGLENKVDSLEKRLASLEGAMPDTAPTPSVQPPAKPEVVENWTLKGVQKDKGLAWVDGPSGFQEVRSGDAIPGVGTVKDIIRYENAWVVVTTKGVILQGE